MSIDGFTLDGRDVTARQLKREGMCYSEGAIQTALESGCKSMADLLAFIERRQSANFRRSYAAGRRAVQRAN